MRISRVPKPVILIVILLSPLLSMAQAFRIGIITDPDSPEKIAPVMQEIRTEIQKTMGSSRQVVMENDNIRAINWDQTQAKNAYQELSGRSDLILLLGGASTHGVLDLAELPTPAISLGVFDPEIQGIPITPELTSGRKNFSYILLHQDPKEDIGEFKRILPFEELAFIYFGKAASGLDLETATKKIREWENELGINITVLPLEQSDVQASMAKIPTKCDAVFLALPFEIAPEQAKEVAEILIAKKLPSFSLGRSYVDQGILASNSDDTGYDQQLRKLAIMTDEVARGESLADMKVMINTHKELFLNFITARRIGYSPPFDIIFTAEIIGDIDDLDLKSYGLLEILQLGLEENLNIQISQQDILLSEQDVKTAVSQFLPSADYSVTGSAVNKGRANPLIGQSQFTLAGKGTLSQLIYSEQAVANIKIQKLLQEAQTYTTDQQILDITLDLVTAYLGILQANTNVVILEENLENSKTNLELARLKQSVGASTNADVYRWQGEVATSQQDLIEARTRQFIVQAQLNALLNNRLGEDFRVKDLLIDGPLFQAYATSPLSRYVNTPEDLGLITEFLIEESKANYPTKRQLLTNAELLERQRVLNKRLYYTPTIAAQAQLDNTFWRGGEGSTPVQGVEFPNNNWSSGLSVSIPLFEGNRRAIDLQTTKIQQEQLNLQVENLDRSLELQVRSNTLELLAASTNINYSRVSAENTSKNYELVQNLYKKGQANIIQLLDAQRAALQTKQVYALSVYDYLLAFMTLENSIGYYALLSSPDDQAALLDRWNDFLIQQKTEDK